jgi:hypothetical protein
VKSAKLFDISTALSKQCRYADGEKPRSARQATTTLTDDTVDTVVQAVTAPCKTTQPECGESDGLAF